MRTTLYRAFDCSSTRSRQYRGTFGSLDAAIMNLDHKYPSNFIDAENRGSHSIVVSFVVDGDVDLLNSDHMDLWSRGDVIGTFFYT